MADVLNKGTLFPEELIPELINKVKGSSALAHLCGAEPIPFNGEKEYTFSMDKEIDVVAESGAYSKGGVALEPVTVIPYKVEYGARVSEEFMDASEKDKIDILKAFSTGFAAKIAKGLDIMAMHGFNPRTGTTSSVIGNNHFDKAVTQKVRAANLQTPDDTIEAAIDLVQGAEYEVNGLILSTPLKSALAKLKDGDGRKMYPELAWGNNPGVLNGVRTETSMPLSMKSSEDRGIVGDFKNAFKWGYSKAITMKVIQYGNPDNDPSLGDLQGHGQVYIRSVAHIGWGILIPKAFARIEEGA